MKKICVITGGTGGIGYNLCKGFYEKGYEVIALDYVQHRTWDVPITFMQVDLRHEQAVVHAFDTIAARHGAIHVLINNGAIAHLCTPLTSLEVEAFDDLMATNVRGSVLCAKAFIQHNEGQTYGRIINIASTRWYQNEADWEAYGASKGALVSLTHTLAVSLAQTPITVNAVSPGWIETADYTALTQEDHRQHPSGRVGKPEDITHACLFLADEASDFINGHNLVVDGGMTKKMIYL